MKPRTLLALSLALLFSTLAPPSLAEPSDKQRAEAPFREGLELHNAGKDEAALAKFEEAYRWNATGNILFNVARMEQLLGRYARALEHYRRCLEDPKLSEVNRGAATGHIESLKARVGELTFEVPSGAAAAVDGVDVDLSKSVVVDPGRHVVKVTRGEESKTVDVNTPPGVATSIRVAFDPPAAPPISAPPPHVEPPKEQRDQWSTAKQVVVIGGAVIGGGLLVGSGVLNAVAERPASGASTTGCGGARAGSSVCAGYADDRATYDGQRTASTVLFWSGAGVGLAALGAALLWPNERVELTAGPVRGGVAGALRVRF